MKAKSIFLAAIALCFATGCTGQNQKVKQSNNTSMNKSIVIFFSHAGDNTKIAADYISEITSADQFEIVIPFTTHEGSGLASCVSDVKKVFPKQRSRVSFPSMAMKCKVEEPRWRNG
jgi:hypothetical protein